MEKPNSNLGRLAFKPSSAHDSRCVLCMARGSQAIQYSADSVGGSCWGGGACARRDTALSTTWGSYPSWRLSSAGTRYELLGSLSPHCRIQSHHYLPHNILNQPGRVLGVILRVPLWCRLKWDAQKDQKTGSWGQIEIGYDGAPDALGMPSSAVSCSYEGWTKAKRSTLSRRLFWKMLHIDSIHTTCQHFQVPSRPSWPSVTTSWKAS